MTQMESRRVSSSGSGILNTKLTLASPPGSTGIISRVSTVIHDGSSPSCCTRSKTRRIGCRTFRKGSRAIGDGLLRSRCILHICTEWDSIYKEKEMMTRSQFVSF